MIQKLINKILKKEKIQQSLENINNLQELKIEDISNQIFSKLDTKYYLNLLQYIDSLKLSKFIKPDIIRLTTFGLSDNKFNLFYNVHLMNLLSILDSEQDYYIPERKVILYGLKSCLTKIPLHLSFFENLYYLYTYNYEEHKFLTFPINLNNRKPMLKYGIKSPCLCSNPIVYLETFTNIGVSTNPFL